MKLYVTVPIALSTFVLGLLSYHPVASALSHINVTSCGGKTACFEGDNTSTGPGVSGLSAKGDGLLGKTGSGIGVAGATGGGTGVSGTSSTGIGVLGNSNTGDGIRGNSNATAGFANGVYGVTNNHGAGVEGQATGLYGEGVYGYAPNGADIFNGNGELGAQFWVDSSANVHASGLLYSGGGCSGGCVRRQVQSYGTTAALPTIEDAGEAQLASGATYVRLNPDFARAIDLRQGYLVFITPEGDTRGLYVTQRSPAGFAVRETLGGRSAVAFAYRIVAHPYGVHAPRLPLVDHPQMRP
jgi:hypothetical protein